MSLFYTSAPKITIICFTVPEICCVTDVIFIFHFGLHFTPPPPPPTTQKKKKKKKKKKNTWRYYFPQVYQKLGATWCKVPEIWCATDGQTDRKKKKDRG